MSEVIQGPLPPGLRNHWWWRPGWAEGRHFYACHLTLEDQPQLRELVAEYQKPLTGVEGIDLIPPEWLHLTMQGIGFTDQISADELAALDHALTAELATIEPPAVEFRYLTIRPGSDLPQGSSRRRAASAAPEDARCSAFRSGACAVHRATARSGGLRAACQHRVHQPRWRGKPITAALSGLAPRTAEVTFAEAGLLEFRRDNRMYEWVSATPVPIG